MKIGIVENEQKDADSLSLLLNEYQKSTDTSFDVLLFKNAFDFLDKKEHFDLLFLDIMMPGIDGMTLANRIREFDESVFIVFVTNMSAYAIKGYEVNAFDYIVKPIAKTHLFKSLDRIIKIFSNKSNQTITINSNNQLYKIDINDIYYIKIESHLMTYVTAKNNYDTWGSLSSELIKLPDNKFIRINANQVANVEHIIKVGAKEVMLDNGELLKLSRKYASDAKKAIINYFKGVA